jgi:very-short-patch-repair endonuclease
MNVGRAPQNPSPLAGEGAERTRSVSEAGEGWGDPGLAEGAASLDPSPGRSLCSLPPSPARGEGKKGVATSSVSREIRRRARALRLRLTDAERKLWYGLRDRRFTGFKFRRQVPIGPFIVGFVCFEQRLVIEVDGGQHAEFLKDQRRDRWLAANGFRVLRFWNNEVLSNFEGVMILLARALNAQDRS